jgi:hypothetical protein
VSFRRILKLGNVRHQFRQVPFDVTVTPEGLPHFLFDETDALLHRCQAVSGSFSFLTDFIQNRGYPFSLQGRPARELSNAARWLRSLAALSERRMASRTIPSSVGDSRDSSRTAL